MPATFPTLTSGSVAKYPLTMGPRFATGVVQFMNDSEQRWAGSVALQQFELVFTNISGYDLSNILAFFETVKGQLDATWSITVSGNTYMNCTLLTDLLEWTENKPNLLSFTLKVRQTEGPASVYVPSANPVYYPQLNTLGMMTQRPYKTALEYSTNVVDMPAGARWSFGWRGTGLTNFPTGPLGRFALNYPALADTELAAALAFFIAMNGKYGPFTFLDPGGNLVTHSENFADASWTLNTLTASGSTIDPFGGSAATTLVGGSSNSFLYTTVLPGGYANGMVFNASVWVRPAVSGNFFIAFVDSGFGVIASATPHLPAGVWTHIEVPLTVSGNTYLRMLIGGAGTWGSGASIALFGAQCVPMIGCGGYMRTPGAYGLHAKCRFDTDTFSPRMVGPNETSLSLPVVEYF